MRKKRIVRFIAIIALVHLFTQQIYAFKLPDIGEIASEAAAGISDAAKGASQVAKDATDKAGETITSVTNTAGKAITDTATEAGKAASNTINQAGEMINDATGIAGKTISDTAGQVGDFAMGTAKQIGDTATVASEQVGNIMAGFAANAQKVILEWAENAGKTAEDVKKTLDDAGVALTVNAAALGNATVEKANDIVEAAGNTAEDALNTVSNAGDFVLDQAGHVVDLASVGVDYVTDSASQAFLILQENGSTIMQTVNDALEGIDLSDETMWESGRQIVHDSIELAVKSGKIPVNIDEETINILSDVVFESAKYGVLYSKGQITVGEYTAGMSEVIIRNGVPTGVSVIAGYLSGGNPVLKRLAKNAAVFVISVAYNDESEADIIEEEEGLLNEVI